MIWSSAPPSQPHRNAQMWLFNYLPTCCVVTDENPEIFGKRDVCRAMRLNWKNANWLWLSKYHCWGFCFFTKQPRLSSVREKEIKRESSLYLSSIFFFYHRKYHFNNDSIALWITYFASSRYTVTSILWLEWNLSSAVPSWARPCHCVISVSGPLTWRC